MSQEHLSFFKDAHNLNITNSTFNAVVNRGGYNGVEVLSNHIATGSIHSSASRQDSPRCHPATRWNILVDIMSWVRDPGRPNNILWINGSAGAGKSAILQTLAERCEEYGLLGASFFFSRGSMHSEHSSLGDRLFATIAFQLAITIPGLQEHVDAAVRADPSIATKGMRMQMEKLILEPMGALLNQHQMYEWIPPAIIIDGLDECVDEKQQIAILQLIIDASNCRSNFPFCVIISSRQVFSLDNFITSPKLQHMTKIISLGNNRDERTTNDDIRAYMRAEFDLIRDDPIHGMQDIPKPWPSDYIINMLVKKSSGQFIFASTVVDYVKNPDCSPEDQLNIILVLLKGNMLYESSNVMGPLDALYRDILTKCPNLRRTLDVIGYVLAMTQVMDLYRATWGAPLNTGVMLQIIDYFLDLNAGDAERAIRRLRPLISLRKSQDTSSGPSIEEQMALVAGTAIKFNHMSFSDFMQTPSRSGEFAIKISVVHANITNVCLKVMTNFNKVEATDSEFLAWTYAVLFWCCHCTLVKQSQRTEMVKTLHDFDASKFWVLPQTMPPIGSHKQRLHNALTELGIQELADCPGQSRWSVGNPDVQSMQKDLKSVIIWLQCSKSRNLAITERYEEVFNEAFLYHLNQSPNPYATLLVLGIVRSGEMSYDMLRSIPAITSIGLDALLESTETFMYRFSAAGDYTRIGIKCKSFSRFLDYKRLLNSKTYLDIAIMLLKCAPHAIAEDWNADDYSQCWTYSLARTKHFPRDMIDLLDLATKLYSSSLYLQRGLRRQHAKRVVTWSKKGNATDIAFQWSSPPIWKAHWTMGEGHLGPTSSK